MVRVPLTPQEHERGRRLGEVLRAARGTRSMTSVAAAVGMSPETLRKIETGRVPTPAFFTVLALCTELGVDLERLADRCAAAPLPQRLTRGPGMDLVSVGVVELALGAVLGWAVAATMITPALVERAGVRKPRRILQAHLDFVIMGILLIAVGLAVPGLPAWLAVAVVVGTWLNPTLFLPLAFSPRTASRRWFQVTSVVSFTLTSGGLVGAAVVRLAG